jgi:hypothetical protein
MKETQSQYETVVAVGSGVFVGTGVFVTGTEVAVAGMGVCVGAFRVMATMVCVTMACTVAAESTGAGCSCWRSGEANTAIGKQATIARAIMPNNKRIELVVIFILHLQFRAGK